MALPARAQPSVTAALHQAGVAPRPRTAALAARVTSGPALALAQFPVLSPPLLQRHPLRKSQRTERVLELMDSHARPLALATAAPSTDGVEPPQDTAELVATRPLERAIKLLHVCI